MEVLLVLVILVILGSLAVTAFSGTQDRANRQAAKTQVNLIVSAARTYYLHMNSYPTSVEDLTQAPSDNSGKWAGPYLEKQVGSDPWENAYQFASPGKHNPDKFDVWSMGPNGIDGDEDDIGNWDASS